MNLNGLSQEQLTKKRQGMRTFWESNMTFERKSTEGRSVSVTFVYIQSSSETAAIYEQWQSIIKRMPSSKEEAEIHGLKSTRRSS